MREAREMRGKRDDWPFAMGALFGFCIKAFAAGFFSASGVILAVSLLW